MERTYTQERGSVDEITDEIAVTHSIQRVACRPFSEPTYILSHHIIIITYNEDCYLIESCEACQRVIRGVVRELSNDTVSEGY